MPTYEYRCRTCDVRFEVQQSFAEESLTLCPAAESEQSPAACAAPGAGEVRKVYSAPSITFKGDGFYKTDSRSGGSRDTNGSPAKKSTEEGAPEGSPESGDAGTKAPDSGGSKGGSDGGSKRGSDGGSKSERAPAGASSS